MASGCLFSAGFLLLLLVALCEARPMALQESDHATVVEEAATSRDQVMAGTSCTAFDIKIDQGQASGVGLPTWAVQITNSCIDHRCSISNIVVQCGQFHSAFFVNPAVFRRLDPTQGTCIVKNGNAIGNGEVIAFRYQENFKEPLSLKSARVSCSG
jgi:hypothetical protein